MRLLSFVTAILFVVAANAQIAGKVPNGKLTVTSYNLRWYGLGGDLNGSPDQESRDEAFQSFLNRGVPASDVYVFEEVVDKDRLELEVVPEGYECISYDHSGEKHQFVVMCASEHYQWTFDPTDDNFALEAVALGSGGLRPATHAILLDSKNKPVARIVGVHLKAMPTFSKQRQQQVTVLAAAIKQMRKDIPTLITGDFNTFPAQQNGTGVDDTTAFTNIFKSAGLNITEAPNASKNTSWSPRYESKFDRFFVDSVWAAYPVKTSGACNDPSQAKRKAYHDNYSDHCPVTLEVPLR